MGRNEWDSIHVLALLDEISTYAKYQRRVIRSSHKRNLLNVDKPTYIRTGKNTSVDKRTFGLKMRPRRRNTSVGDAGDPLITHGWRLDD